MEITGYDYVIYSQHSIFEIIEEFKKEIKKIWQDAVFKDIENNQTEKLWVFFAKDKQMNDDLDTAYELNDNLEGCFSLIGKKIIFEDSIVGNIDNDVVSHQVRLLFKDFWEYTIILPELIEKNFFSEQVYNILILLLSKGNTVNAVFNKIHKPVQHFI